MSTSKAKALRLGFAGTPAFAAAHLSALIEEGHQIVAVWTQPDRPAGRGKHTQGSPVKEVALNQNIPVLQPQKLLDANQVEMAAYNLDLLIVVAYGLLLPQAVLNTPALGCINVHASLLPRWRGAAPIQRAIEAGDPETGVCIMQMDAGLDTGDVLSRTSFPLRSIDSTGTVHDRLIQEGVPLLLRTIDEIATGKSVPSSQDDEFKTYAAKISKAEAEIVWSKSATELDRKIRAFNPAPVAFTTLAGDRIRIWQSYPLSDQSLIVRPENVVAGTILACSSDGIDVACGEGILRLKQLQLPGKKPTAVAELLRGNSDRFQLGSLFGSQSAQS